MNTQTIQILAPSETVLMVCQHAWESHRFYFKVVSPVLYSGWRIEDFNRESTIDSKILKRMDVLEEVVSPDHYLIAHEPPKLQEMTERQKRVVQLLVAGAVVSVVLVGAAGLLAVGAASAVAPVAAVALADPAVIAVMPTGEWLEIAWWWE